MRKLLVHEYAYGLDMEYNNGLYHVFNRITGKTIARNKTQVTAEDLAMELNNVECGAIDMYDYSSLRMCSDVDIRAHLYPEDMVLPKEWLPRTWQDIRTLELASFRKALNTVTEPREQPNAWLPLQW